MIEYAIDAVRSQVDDLLINANRNLDIYAGYGLRVIQDKSDNFPGPLAGIAAGIEAATTDLVLTVPCDSPLLPANLASRLGQSLHSGPHMVAVAHDGERMQPVFALYRKEILQKIYSYLDAGEHKLQLWMDRQRLVCTDFSDLPQAFTNINTPEERLKVERIITSL